MTLLYSDREKHHHVTTLTADTPKSRRRVRRTLGMKPGAPLAQTDPEAARSVALERERTFKRKAKK